MLLQYAFTPRSQMTSRTQINRSVQGPLSDAYITALVIGADDTDTSESEGTELNNTDTSHRLRGWALPHAGHMANLVRTR